MVRTAISSRVITARSNRNRRAEVRDRGLSFLRSSAFACGAVAGPRRVLHHPHGYPRDRHCYYCSRAIPFRPSLTTSDREARCEHPVFSAYWSSFVPISWLLCSREGASQVKRQFESAVVFESERRKNAPGPC